MMPRLLNLSDRELEEIMDKEIDVEAELTAILAQEISAEIDAGNGTPHVESDTLPDPGGFTIMKYQGWVEGSRQVYGIRGNGTVYRDFYQTWYDPSKVVWCRTDFPWDYNTFTDEAEKDLVEKWGQYITYLGD